ncbi:MAG: flagellar basal body L-ring protein FlgH [Planctomycetaceae bacterium]|jgi:flagellar basal body L-ring protein FlgH|nr:flagellar basal body L-ring protein FlgH [Planctomycetaceae bacterium]
MTTRKTHILFIFSGLFLFSLVNFPLSIKEACAQSGSLGGTTALMRSNGERLKMSEVSRMYQAAPRQKVYKENDLIQVHVVHKWSFNNTANNQRKKSIKTKSKVSAWFKLPDSIFSFPIKSDDPLPEIGAELDHKTQNQGNLLRRETLEFDIGCRITSVYENGNLFVEGTEKLQIGEEGKVMHVSGIIRPEDIAGNTVASSVMVDLAIEEVPSGNVYDTARRTWGARLIEHWKPL